MSIFRKKANIVVVDGRTDHPKYSVYRGMVGRCYESEHPAYRWYGAEGVVVCEEWLDPYEGFWRFAEWHDNNIPKGMSMDKDNTAKLYSPTTVVAGSVMQQRLNTRPVKAHNTSGTQGVCWSKSANCWSCNMDVFTKKVFIGNYDNQDEAKSVYDSIYSFRLKNPEDKDGVFELIEFYKEERESQKLALKITSNWKDCISTEGEVWKSFDEYPNYTFSNKGRAFSFSDMKLMSPCKSTKDGLYALKLRYNGKSRKTNLSRIIGELFIPNIDNKPMVCFKDGDNDNISVDNLVWLTRKELMQKNIAEGRYKNTGENAGNSKLSNKDVFFIRANYKDYGDKLSAKALSEMFSVTVNTIYDIAKNRTFKDI